ncbi:DoxX family protein [Rhodobacteraceae bacterium]|nr:DoxX family protein [Paracoccaceae bacterium]
MKYLLWGAMAVVSAVMIIGGYAHLTDAKMSHVSFTRLGLPNWFGYFIGACEILGGIGLWLRRTSFLAAIGIGVIMVGAIFYHVSFPPFSAGVPAMMVMLCSIFIIMRKGGGVVG